ncbi:histidine phosphatase family protein [Selenomonas sp. AB3002]|uniref:histidine phosphatase family protein n=1 Tax=Selenomonas sp. AB3002 TaxID=1392502 RepID=UPI00049698F5
MIDIEQFNSGNRICAFIRHGEKDVEKFSLTDIGRKNVINFSKLLLALQKPILIYTSPEDRCIETATIVSSTIGNNKYDYITSNYLGKPGIQVKNEIEYAKLTNLMKCREIFAEWKTGMHYDAMYNPTTIRTKILDFFTCTSINNGITLYISQSGTIACTGYSLGLVDYMVSDREWVDYLDGYILRL